MLLGMVKQCQLKRNLGNSCKAAVEDADFCVTCYTPVNMWFIECKAFDYEEDAI